MKYIISLHKSPMCVGFTLFKGQQDLIRSIVEQKSVRVLVEFNSKTSLSVSLSAGDACLKASYIPQGCERMKFLKQTTYSFVHSKTITSNNFKVLKSQKWDEFKQYIIALLDSLHLCAEEINVNIFMDNTIRSLLNAPAYTDNEKKL